MGPTTTPIAEPSSVEIRVDAPLDGKRLGLKIKDSVVVEVVDQRALQFGWQVGDVVDAVNGVPVTDMVDIASATAAALRQWESTARPITFNISRSGAKPSERRRKGGGCC